MQAWAVIYGGQAVVRAARPLHVAIDQKGQQGGLQHYLVLVEKGNAKSLRSRVSSMYYVRSAPTNYDEIL